jgi:eukaryotic-like serine/threonine-protein kinase
VPLVKVTDFRLALTKWAVNENGRLTDPGTALGTPVYMAPEQYRGGSDLDHRLDIYGLGATVYHALAGKPPFQGRTIWKLMANKIEHPSPSWPAVSPESVALLSAMMAPEVRQRIGTYEELIDRIETMLRNFESRTALRPVRRPHRRRRILVAAGALVATGLAIGLTAKSVRSPAAAPRYVSRGSQEALFDSQTMTGWLPPAVGGMWHVEADDEKTTVLTGTGFTRRLFVPSDDYRVTIGLDVHTASEAEVHFALPEASPDAGRRFVLRVSKAEGAIFGAKDGDKGEFQPLGKPIAFPPAAWFEGRPPYLELRFQRAGGAWSVWFKGTLAGRAADDDTRKRAEVRIAAVGGQARVDSVILERLAPGHP